MFNILFVSSFTVLGFFLIHRFFFSSLLCAINCTGKSEAKVRLQLFCVPVICLLFAFNKRGESTRQMCLLSPGIPLHWTGVPSAAEEVPSAWLCLPWREGITKLSHTGLAYCPARAGGAQPSPRPSPVLVACPQRKAAKSCLCVQHCFVMVGPGTSVLPVTASPRCHSSPHHHKLSSMKKHPLDACWKPDVPGAKRGRFEWP